MVIPPSGKETIMNKQKHLNLEARILIETMLNEHHSFKSIARELGKDCTTISKEIKAHICFEKIGALGNLSSSMMWYLLSSKKGSPFITLRYIMLTNL